ncbi:MAG: response regulator [Lentisphaeria bacterium]|nr:response regulator [Lentisphaeria bacterium]NQZ67460.1 response regulator [Lentisphaeria bacterium]
MNVRILVVDDEIDIRTMLERHFKYLGYEVYIAGNGEEALQIIDTVKIDVIITDIKMPVMDGIALLEEVNNEYPLIRCIVITGYVTMDNILSCMNAHARTCIYKPLEDLSKLEKAVEDSVEDLQHWLRKLEDLSGMKHTAKSETHEEVQEI